MLRDGAHRVVGDARWLGATDPGGIGEEGIEAAVAALQLRSVTVLRDTICALSAPWRSYIIEVNVRPSIVSQHKVSDGVSTLDRLRIRGKRFEKPRVLRLDEVVGALVRP